MTVTPREKNLVISTIIKPRFSASKSLLLIRVHQRFSPQDSVIPPPQYDSYQRSLTMCMKATCGSCSKTTWWGCGQHIPGVLDQISSDEWCTCEPKVEFNGKKYPPKASAK
ncbi:hypothetical protein F5Y15DRAFT_383224 [Xylariaceae sp. FL0016]|nr:hypothetical protein F5Y15DRAFT_383224 [Xylariaceae sp. FL0016]